MLTAEEKRMEMKEKEKMEPWQCESRLGKTWRPQGR